MWVGFVEDEEKKKKGGCAQNFCSPNPPPAITHVHVSVWETREERRRAEEQKGRTMGYAFPNNGVVVHGEEEEESAQNIHHTHADCLLADLGLRLVSSLFFFLPQFLVVGKHVKERPIKCKHTFV